MSVMNREKAEKYAAALEQFGINLTYVEGNRFYSVMEGIIAPPTQTIGVEELQDAIDLLQQHINGLEQGQVVNLDGAMTVANIGPDHPAYRSARIRLRKFMLDNKLLTHKPQQGEVWTKFVADHSPGLKTGTAA
jgi:hypothetical protein